MMKFTYGLPVGLLGAAVVMIQPSSAVALTTQEVDAVAREITVRIDGKNDAYSGSGIIIERNGDNYFVLTNWHVVEDKGDYTIYTHEGKRYLIKSSQVQRLPGVDLAVLVFNSSTNYKTASIGNPSQLQNGMKLRVTGYPLPGPVVKERTYISLSGEISGRLSKPDNGYELIYAVSPALSGMSGGPILNENGQVVGVNGLGEVDARTGNVSVVLGISINTYQRLATATVKNLLQQNITFQADNFVKMGHDKHKKGDYQEAIIAYTEAIRINPNSKLVLSCVCSGTCVTLMVESCMGFAVSASFLLRIT
jgi:S1-C subfamily serine protease